MGDAMSGGRYNYLYTRVETMAYDLFNYDDPLRNAFAKHLLDVAAAMKAIEWVDSGDSPEEAIIEPVAKALGEDYKKVVTKEALEQIKEIEQKLDNILHKKQKKCNNRSKNDMAARQTSVEDYINVE